MANFGNLGGDEINDPTLHKIINEMIIKHNCHTVILYGSRARNEFSSSSDYDIIAIRENGEIEKDCRVIDGAYLDAFIYSEDYINTPDSSLIRIKDGIVLVQKNAIGDKLLNKVRDIFSHGPDKTPLWEKQEITIWLPKMLARSKRADNEGNYRRNWLLYELLQSYFRLRDLWYLGPKESFSWLEKNDPEIFTDFSIALIPGSNDHNIEKLIEDILKKYSPLKK